MQDAIERQLEDSERFDDAAEIEVVPVQVNDFGEGEYEARFAYPADYEATAERDFLARLKRDLEEVLPAAWVNQFSISSDLAEGNNVAVIFDYRPGDGSGAS